MAEGKEQVPANGPELVKMRHYYLLTPNHQHESASNFYKVRGRLHSALTHGHLLRAMTGVIEARGDRLNRTCARKAPAVKVFPMESVLVQGRAQKHS